jgi:uncharacterized protein (TIGR02757 family)
MRNENSLKALLDEQYERFNHPSFIEMDPISVPHAFTKKQDIEIAGFFAAVLAWGQRKTIISKSRDLMKRLDNSPHQFVLDHTVKDLKGLENFAHRTFNGTDLLFFVHVLKEHFLISETLEDMFLSDALCDPPMKGMLSTFHNRFFQPSFAPSRTRKHVPTPMRGSACKRLNMYLRWMVRKDSNGVDFGIWNRISMADLICPLDVHVERVARRLRLLERKQTDWLAAVELTENLKEFDTHDPVKYDFALFGIGKEKI